MERDGENYTYKNTFQGENCNRLEEFFDKWLNV